MCERAFNQFKTPQISFGYKATKPDLICPVLARPERVEPKLLLKHPESGSLILFDIPDFTTRWMPLWLDRIVIKLTPLFVAVQYQWRSGVLWNLLQLQSSRCRWGIIINQARECKILSCFARTVACFWNNCFQAYYCAINNVNKAAPPLYCRQKTQNLEAIFFPGEAQEWKEFRIHVRVKRGNLGNKHINFMLLWFKKNRKSF